MKTFEEINIIKEGGKDYGWPCLNGPNIQEPFFASEQVFNDFCATAVPAEEHIQPAIYWHRNDSNFRGTAVGFTGNCVAGAAIYYGTRYPAQYRLGNAKRAVFFADYGQMWIRVAWFDDNHNFLESQGIQMFAGNFEIYEIEF
jgi:hypothetical protein